MSKIVWHKGPPPSVGWWPASAMQDPSALRWWDGERWSRAAYRGYTVEEISMCARERNGVGRRSILWTDRPASWPKRSRT